MFSLFIILYFFIYFNGNGLKILDIKSNIDNFIDIYSLSFIVLATFIILFYTKSFVNVKNGFILAFGENKNDEYDYKTIIMSIKKLMIWIAVFGIMYFVVNVFEVFSSFGKEKQELCNLIMQSILPVIYSLIGIVAIMPIYFILKNKYKRL